MFFLSGSIAVKRRRLVLVLKVNIVNGAAGSGESAALHFMSHKGTSLGQADRRPTANSQ